MNTSDFVKFLDELLLPGQKREWPARAVSVMIGSRDASWEADWRQEAARLLRHAAALVENDRAQPGDGFALLDVNGNRIGSLHINR